MDAICGRWHAVAQDNGTHEAARLVISVIAYRMQCLEYLSERPVDPPTTSPQSPFVTSRCTAETIVVHQVDDIVLRPPKSFRAHGVHASVVGAVDVSVDMCSDEIKMWTSEATRLG